MHRARVFALTQTMEHTMAGKLAGTRIGLMLAAMALLGPGCSLVSIKTPEKPLSPRDLNARILTHEFATRFAGAVQHSADDIAAATGDPRIRLNALRWKISATAASLEAASQMAPMLALLDTWALAEQMHDYLDTGAGRALFGAQQPAAVALSALLLEEASGIVQRLTQPAEFASDRQFVRDYCELHPIDSLDFARASMVSQWDRQQRSGSKLADSLGTVPEALGQAGDLLRLYADAAPSQMLWKAQLGAQQSGLDEQEVRAALQRLDARFAQLTALAQSTPQMVNAAARDVRVQLEASWSRVLAGLHDEGTAMADRVSTEREAALRAVDAQRTELTADAGRLAQQVVNQAGEQLRRLVREALLLVILLTVLILGLPFAAGFLVGRARRS